MTPQRLTGLVLVSAAVILPAWAVYLAVVLPHEHVSPNWDVVWVGLDLGLATLAAIAFLSLRRRSRWAPVLAGALAAALICDAWFDVMTSDGDDRRVAIALAVLLELPIAVVAVVAGVRSTDGLRPRG